MEQNTNGSDALRQIPPSIAPPIQLMPDSFELNSFSEVINFLHNVKSEKYHQVVHEILQQCHQCRKVIPRDSNVLHFTYLLPCLHTMCLSCVNVFKTEKIVCNICKQHSDKKHIPMLNQIVTPPELCNAKRGCKNKTTGLCDLCHVMCCDNCYNESHVGHQRSTDVPLTIPCSKHSKVAALFICSCKAYMCENCRCGLGKVHIDHGHPRPLAPFDYFRQSVDLQVEMDYRRLNTQTTYSSLIDKAQEMCDQHFNNLKVDMTLKFFEFMNTVMNKFNDCCQEVSHAEVKLGKVLEECGRMFKEHSTKCYTFNTLCENVVHNFPSRVMHTFIAECFSRLKHEQQRVLNTMAEIDEQLLALPHVEFNIDQMSRVFDQSIKVFGHRDLRAPYLTNQESKFFNLDLSEVMKVSLKGELPRKRSAGGPLAVSINNAKKRREHFATADNAPPVTAITTLKPPVSAVTTASLYRHSPNTIMSNSSRTMNSVYSRGPYARPGNSQLPTQVQQPFGYQPPQQGFRMLTPRTVTRLSTLNLQRPSSLWNLNNLNDISTISNPNFRARTSTSLIFPQSLSRSSFPEVESRLPLRSIAQTPSDDGSPRKYADTSIISTRCPLTLSAKDFPRQPPLAPLTESDLLTNTVRQLIGPFTSLSSSSSRSGTCSAEPLRGRAPPRILPMPSSSASSVISNVRRRQTLESRTVTANVTKASAEKQAELVAILANASADMQREEAKNGVNRQVRQKTASLPLNQTTTRSDPVVTSVPNSPNQKSSGKLKMRIRLSQSKPKKPANEEQWDDYCAICNQGGDLICCDGCPKVYHNNCHIPNIRVAADKLPDDWQCNRCVSRVKIQKITNTFNAVEREACAQVLMACYEDPNRSEPFERNVPRSFKEYYAAIVHPMCFKTISNKVETYEYKNIFEFIADMNLIFSNCVSFNPPGSEIEMSARFVYNLYLNAVRSQLKPYLDKVWCYTPKSSQ